MVINSTCTQFEFYLCIFWGIMVDTDTTQHIMWTQWYGIHVKAKPQVRPWFFYYSFYGSADRLFWGFGKKIKLLLHTFFILADSRS